jgi:hypothetical protein
LWWLCAFFVRHCQAEINMIIGCGIREESGIYGGFRIPFEEVYFKL